MPSCRIMVMRSTFNRSVSSWQALNLEKTLLSAMFLFFKQKTAYEILISDWSSDLCSSDLDRNAAFRQHFLKVAIADRIATIPAHRPQDHITLEMAPLEIRHRSVRPISAKHAQASRFLQQSPSAASVRMTICRP